MTEKIVIITGANSGLGKSTALEIAEMGATIVMVVRDEEKGNSVREEIVERTGNQDIDILVADLSLMSEVRRAAKEFKEKYSRLDVLVNNAGGIIGERILTHEGYEYTTALNYLAPVLLTHELLDALSKSSNPRVVNVSSAAHNFSNFDLTDTTYEEGYSSFKAYGTSKLYLIMHTYKLADALKHSNISVNVLHPGFVRTNFGRSDNGIASRFFLKLTSPFQKSADDGARTQIFLATSNEVDGISGKYYAEKKIKTTKSISYDKEKQQELWDWTNDVLKIAWHNIPQIGVKQ